MYSEDMIEGSLTNPSASRKNIFTEVAPQGFGDRQNSWAWSMIWWRGKLFVGTNRAWPCAERAAINAAFPLFSRLPFVKYPPEDPDMDCTEDPIDLPLQAEIWCWIPDSDTWQRLYQSPIDAPVPGEPGKFVARDIGYRQMEIFIEPDGTEALYVSGANTKFIYRKMPPPRLLRSVDGANFYPVPQKPGTVMGDLEVSTLRTVRSYNGRMFLIAGAMYGDGVLLESSNPALGNDSFRYVSPPEVRIFDMLPYNGYLYLGLRDTKNGYAVVKTKAAGKPPYHFIPVVAEGAYLSPPSQSAVCMEIFRGRLYVGTDRPAELIRINPDDSWDLVIGTPRQTPDGWKYPLSGLDAGFYNWLNGHIWRMQVYEGRLYLGTMNMSTYFRNTPGARAVLEPNHGFDLFSTGDGLHFQPITQSGFGDKFNFGLRSFASTPYGLFVGTANSHYGLKILRGASNHTPPSNATNAESPPPPPGFVEAEFADGNAILSWEPTSPGNQFRVLRATIEDERQKLENNAFLASMLKLVRKALKANPQLYLPPLPKKLWIPGAFAEIGATERHYFVDTTASEKNKFLYYVRAENEQGNISDSSNIVALPSLAPQVTFESLSKMIRNQQVNSLLDELKRLKLALQSDNWPRNHDPFNPLISLAESSDELNFTKREDIVLTIKKLRRKWQLSQLGLIPCL